jgi:hypothetical protein
MAGPLIRSILHPVHITLTKRGQPHQDRIYATKPRDAVVVIHSVYQPRTPNRGLIRQSCRMDRRNGSLTQRRRSTVVEHRARVGIKDDSAQEARASGSGHGPLKVTTQQGVICSIALEWLHGNRCLSFDRLDCQIVRFRGMQAYVCPTDSELDPGHSICSRQPAPLT